MSILVSQTIDAIELDLVQSGVVDGSVMSATKQKALSSSAPLLSLLVEDGIISHEQLTKSTAHVTNVPYVNLSEAKINPKTLSLLPSDIAEHYMAVPLGEMQNRLVVAMIDAGNVQAVDFLSNRIGRPLKVYLASEGGIKSILTQYKNDLNKEVADAFAVTGADEIRQDSDIKMIVQDSPISKALSAILDYAARSGASDVHIEPLENELKIRCRIDGILREIMKLPKSTEAPLVSRIKILSNLKIDEHRIPQDGQFTVRAAGKGIDLRIAISPVVWGEQVVIRLLDKSSTSLKLEDMGFKGRALRCIRKGIDSPNGMILTSGPTGSGKSTSLYALVQEIKNDGINIVTLEDPVEYKMDGINQIQVNTDVGLTFASGLRSILRQDPDCVMVGEIRDAETAALAIQAALTGHLVFSTLHTNSAAGILPRLLEMGIEPFLIASTVRTVIGQRLVRRIPDPRPIDADLSQVEAIHQVLGSILPASKEDVAAACKDIGYDDLPLRAQNAYTLYEGTQKPDTPDGFKGRMGLYEVFNVTESIQELILKQATSAEIQKAAQVQGMLTMRQDGYLKALAGYTTINEVNRVASTSSA